MTSLCFTICFLCILEHFHLYYTSVEKGFEVLSSLDPLKYFAMLRSHCLTGDYQRVEGLNEKRFKWLVIVDICISIKNISLLKSIFRYILQASKTVQISYVFYLFTKMDKSFFSLSFTLKSNTGLFKYLQLMQTCKK